MTSSRTVLCTLSLLVLSLLLISFGPSPSSSCGGVTHYLSALRALKFFSFKEFPQAEKYVKTYISAFQAGSSFPDWGYFCTGYNDPAEAAHWPPFIRTAANYIQQKYVQPAKAANTEVSTAGQQLIAFYMGIVAHSVADIPWHALNGLNLGYIDALSWQNFQSVYNTAHQVADYGGEVVVNDQYDMDLVNTTWTVPYDDILQIYQLVGYNITKSAMVSCTSYLYSLSMQAKYYGNQGYDLYGVNKSPMMTQHYKDYYLGGVDDLSAWTTICFSSSLRWLVNGSDAIFCGVEGNLATAKAVQEAKENFNADGDIEVHQTKEVKNVPRSLHVDEKLTSEPLPTVTVSEQDSIVNLDVTDEWKESLISAKHRPKPTPCPVTANQSITFYSSLDDSNAGSALAVGDVNGDGIDDLIVGSASENKADALQVGSVYVVLGRRNFSPKQFNQPIDISTFNNGSLDIIKISNPEGNKYTRFGSAVTILDINLDGFDDIVISAPSYGADTITYSGAVYIYYGGRRIKKNVQLAPSVTFYGDSYNVIGSVLTHGDINGDGHKDLLIGSPWASNPGVQRGSVTAVLAKRSGYPVSGLLSASRALFLYNDLLGAWMGRSMGVHVYKGRRILMIGAPSRHNSTTQNVGFLYGYDISNYTNPKQIFTLQGNNEFDMLGYSFSIGRPYKNKELYISVGMASSKENISNVASYQAGRVLVFPLSVLIPSWNSSNIALSVKDLPSTTVSIIAAKAYAHMGEQVLFTDLDDDGADELLASSPTLGPSNTGAVYLFNSGSAFPNATVQLNPSSQYFNFTRPSFTVNGSDKSHGVKMFFGKALTVGDLNGDGKKEIIISAPRDSVVVEQGGSIHVFFQ